MVIGSTEAGPERGAVCGRAPGSISLSSVSRSMASKSGGGDGATTEAEALRREARAVGGEEATTTPGAPLEAALGWPVESAWRLPADLCVRSCCFMLSLRVKALLQVGHWMFFSPVCFLPWRAACPEVVNVSGQE